MAVDSHDLKALFEQGLRLHHAGRLAEALEAYSRFALLNDGHPDIYNNMGVALRALGHYHAAVACYERALTLKPGGSGTWSNMGNALRELGRFDEALVAHNRTLSQDGPSPSLMHNIGIVYRDLGRMEEALAWFERGIAIEPDHVNCQWDRALALLMLGDYGRGFRDYEWRWKTDKARSRRLGDKLWQGQNLEGRTLLLTTEQGFGDAIQWMRFIPQAAARGARVIVETQPELERLFACVDGVDGLIPAGTLPGHYDAQLPLLSLSGTLGVTLETLPRQVPYLRLPPIPEAQILPPVRPGQKRVGLVWAGKLRPRDRSCPLPLLAPLFGHVQARFFSLQMGERRDDIQKFGFAGLISDLGQQIQDFVDMAQWMRQMDLIITIDSGPAHLAGALGVPTWNLLLYAADWRWMLNRSDSPWYPHMRLFRQIRHEDWTEPTQALQAAFRTWMQGGPLL